MSSLEDTATHLTICSENTTARSSQGRLGAGQGFSSCGKWKLEPGLGKEGNRNLGGSQEAKGHQGSEILVLSARVAGVEAPSWHCKLYMCEAIVQG